MHDISKELLKSEVPPPVKPALRAGRKFPFLYLFIGAFLKNLILSLFIAETF